MSILEELEARDYEKSQGNWYPASGGTEEPFYTKSGRRALYVYQPSTGKHAYLDLDTDIVVPDNELSWFLG